MPKKAKKSAPKRTSVKAPNASGSQKTSEEDFRKIFYGETMSLNADLSRDFPPFDPEFEDNGSEAIPRLSIETILERNPWLQEQPFSVNRRDGSIRVGVSFEYEIDDGRKLSSSVDLAGYSFFELWISQQLEALGSNNELISLRAKNTLKRSLRLLVQAFKAEAESDNKEVIELLHKLAAHGTEVINRCVDNNPVPFKKIAQSERTWPVNLGPRKKDREAAEKHLKNINLSEGLVKNISKPGANLDARPTRIAAELISYVETVRKTLIEHGDERICYPFPKQMETKIRKLKPFNSDNIPSWWKVIWEVLLHFTDGEPQVYYGELGEYREPRAQSRDARKIPSLSSYESQNKGGIQSRLQQAVGSLAKERPLG